MVQAGRERLWLLETLRTYAAERLAPEERLELRKRHAHDTARRLTALAGQLMTEDEAEAVSALAELGADLHAAWTYAAGEERPLAVVAGRRRLSVRLPPPANGPSRVGVARRRLGHRPRVDSAGARGGGRGRVGGRTLEEAEQLTGRGIAAAGGEDCPAAARTVIQRANLAMFLGRNAEALAGFRRGAALHRAAGSPLSRCWARSPSRRP